MAKTQFLNEPDDVQWLKDTALKGVAGVPNDFQSFVITGNEDAPDKLELFKAQDPHYRDPCVTFKRDKQGNMKRVQL